MAFIREIHTADGRPLQEALPRDAALKDFVDLKKHGNELDRESFGRPNSSRSSKASRSPRRGSAS